MDVKMPWAKHMENVAKSKAKVKTKRRLSWPVGILVVPFLVVCTIGLCLLGCCALVFGALIGKLTIESDD